MWCCGRTQYVIFPLLLNRSELVLILAPLVWYYFNDIYPPTHEGHRPLDPPQWWVNLWERQPAVDQQDTGAADVQGDFAAAAAPVVQ